MERSAQVASEATLWKRRQQLASAWVQKKATVWGLKNKQYNGPISSRWLQYHIPQIGLKSMLLCWAFIFARKLFLLSRRFLTRLLDELKRPEVQAVSGKVVLGNALELLRGWLIGCRAL